MATATVPAAMPPLRLTDVDLVREGRAILSPLSWTVEDFLSEAIVRHAGRALTGQRHIGIRASQCARNR